MYNRYDDPQSLRLKYDYALSQGLAGFGPFTWGDIDCTAGTNIVVEQSCIGFGIDTDIREINCVVVGKPFRFVPCVCWFDRRKQGCTRRV